MARPLGNEADILGVVRFLDAFVWGPSGRRRWYLSLVRLTEYLVHDSLQEFRVVGLIGALVALSLPPYSTSSVVLCCLPAVTHQQVRMKSVHSVRSI